MIYHPPPEEPLKFDAEYFAEARKKARAEAKRQIADERARAQARSSELDECDSGERMSFWHRLTSRFRQRRIEEKNVKPSV